MKRLYVGGLSHSVTDKDLKDRFGKFGKVEDVELKTRTDERGVPFKTFGYINVTMSDSELHKCLSVLNRSQWKGGTLRIETAKESVLQRLAQEREDRLSLDRPKPSSQQQVLDSLKDSNFTMKSAVPGSEVPGHKDWVVGKFGRVLPVLQLKCRRGDKVKTLKYDPSKYGQNLRVLAPPPGPEDTPTPVSQLTWTIEGGDDDMSRKRRGEFPPFTPKKKKKKKDRPSSDLIGRLEPLQEPIRAPRPPLDNESDEELRRHGNSSHNALGPHDDDTLEVVSSDFTNKRKDEDCDSADTDELFSRKTQTNPNKTFPEKKRKKQNGRRSKSEHDSTDDEEEEDSGKKKAPEVKKTAKMSDVKNVQRPDKKRREEEGLKRRNIERREETKQGDNERREETKQGDNERREETKQGDNERREETKQGDNERREETKQGDNERREETKQGDNERREETKQGDNERREETKRGDNERREETKRGDHKRREETKRGDHERREETKRGEEERTEETDDGDEEEDSESDHEYEAFFSNVTRLEMSLSDLQTLAEKFAPEGSTPTPRILGVDDVRAPPRKGTTPEEILASLLEADSSDEEEEEEERKGRKSRRKSAAVMSLPVFRGTGELEPEKKKEVKTEEKQDEESSSRDEVSPAHSEEDSSEEDLDKVRPTEDESVSRPITAGVCPARANQKRPGPEEEAELQRRANERRLAAVHQRQKETEQNRKLIQGALSTLDGAPGGSGGKHIVFGSDDEDEAEENRPQQTEQPPANQSTASSAPRLFDSDEDEEEEEEEEGRFETRPEFEGAAGQKLMALQSRFGTDERFKMDARFLDDDDNDDDNENSAAGSDQQEALQQEKQKNLSILQSVLGPGAAPTRPAGGARAQTFRDVSTLHYDPSNTRHAAFEKNLLKNDSKATRRRSREEAHKLPQVSNEMYFEVKADLKNVFKKETEKQKKDEKQENNWDQEEGEEEGGDEERGDEEGGDQEEGEEERGDEERGDEERGDEERGDEERGDEERGDEERGDEERGDEERGDEERGGEERGDEERGDEERGDEEGGGEGGEEPEKEESGGFKFSFFGDEPDPQPQQTEYKVQIISAPKLSWQQNPSLNDSSDEEEEQEEEEQEEEEQEEEEQEQRDEEEEQEEEGAATLENCSGRFFFFPNDPRLTDGARWFCRTSLEELRETWNQTRTHLRQDCKKKHKDARRKLRVRR